MHQLAVIDLGTNTFHLLVVAIDKDSTFSEVYRERRFIKLAEEGITTIGEAPYQRGQNALKDFRRKLDELNVKNVQAFGTAALRTASNGKQFITDALDNSAIEITLITGDLEAQLIHKGVQLAVPMIPYNSMIMDIGGGSVEFIICDAHQVTWYHSFPVGVAVLYKQFHHTEPITKAEISAIHSFLDEQLGLLIEKIKEYQPNVLIGASGTFDVLEYALASTTSEISTMNKVEVADFPLFYNSIVQLTKTERYEHASIPDDRADMITVALVLLDYVLKKAPIKEIIVSAYAMKEGMLADMISR